MSNVNYHFLLGQIMILQRAVSEKFEDGFLEAVPINSLLDLSSDISYSEFLSYSDNSSTIIRNICFTSSNDTKDIAMRFADKVSIHNSFGLSLSPYPVTNYGLNIDINSITSSLLDKGSHNHTYYSVTVRLTDVEVSPTPTSIKRDNAYPASQNFIENIETFHSPYGNGFADVKINDDFYVYNKKFELIDTNSFLKVNTPPGSDNEFIIYFKNGFFVGEGTSAFIYDNSLNDKLKDEPLYNNSFYQTSIGCNFLIITKIKYDDYGDPEKEYFKSKVGDIFCSALPKAALSCPVLEIRPLFSDVSQIISKLDYEDFFDFYGIQEDTFDISTLVPNLPSSGDVFAQASAVNEIGTLSDPAVPQILKDNLNTYVDHSTYLLTEEPDTVKVKAFTGSGTSTQAYKITLSTGLVTTEDGQSLQQVSTIGSSLPYNNNPNEKGKSNRSLGFNWYIILKFLG